MAKSLKKPKGSYQHGSLKEALLKAAFATIKKNGGVHFSLREVATLAGVSPMAAYRHYESKEAIIIEICNEGFKILSDDFRKALSHNPKDLQALGIAYVNFAVKNPVHFQVMFHPDARPAVYHESPRPEDEQAYNLLIDCVKANQSSGTFNDTQVDFLATTAWATVHGLATLLVNRSLNEKLIDSDEKVRALIEAVTGTLMRGFSKK